VPGTNQAPPADQPGLPGWCLRLGRHARRRACGTGFRRVRSVSCTNRAEQVGGRAVPGWCLAPFENIRRRRA